MKNKRVKLSCGAKSPRDCFSCRRADCDCNDYSLTEEGEWMRAGIPLRRKSSTPEAQVTVVSIDYDTMPRPAKSNVRRNNYEFLFY